MIEEPAEEPINADPTYAPLIEAERQAAADAAAGRQGPRRPPLLRAGEEAGVAGARPALGRDPADPGARAGASPERKERRRAVWRSVITQQLQADEFAVEMAGQLLNLAPHRGGEALLLDDGAGRGAPHRGVAQARDEAGGVAERDPHLDKLAKMTLEADTLEEKVFQMQVFFERLIIPRFRLIARSSRGHDARGPLQPAHDRRRHPPQLRRRLRAHPARGRLEEDEGPAHQGGQPAAADLRRARALAAEGARVDRERDARHRHPPAAGGRAGRDPDGVEPRPGRLRGPRSPSAPERPPIPPHHDPACFGCGDHELGLRMALPEAEGAETYAVGGDLRPAPPGRAGDRARRHRRRGARRGVRPARDVAPLPDRDGALRRPLPAAGRRSTGRSASRRASSPSAAAGSRSPPSSATATSCSPRPTARSSTSRSSTSSRRPRAAPPARPGAAASRIPRTGERARRLGRAP